MIPNTANEIQLRAIRHFNGPAQVIAGPGSGKTFTIIQRILFLTSHYKVDPSHILVVTFTRAAALEMQERYKKEIKLDDQRNGVCFGTFHSICYQILKESGGISASTLITGPQKRKIAEVLLQNRGMEAQCDFDTLEELLSEISQIKNQSFNHHALMNGIFSDPDTIYGYMEDYDNMLKEQNKLDFDDMILKCMSLLKEKINLLKLWQSRFHYILIDEFQDINQVQYEVMKLLAADKHNLFVVGDDDQSIYGFRGAAPGIMKSFIDDFNCAEKFILNINYRSRKAITDAAEKVILHNKDRISKKITAFKSGGSVSISEYETRTEEEGNLIKILSSCTKEALNRKAVIVRTNTEAKRYHEVLKEAGIPVAALIKKKDDLYDHFIMADLEAFLSFIYCGHSRANFLKIMNKPERYITRLSLGDEIISQMSLLSYYEKNIPMKNVIRQLFSDLERASNYPPWLAIHFFRKTMKYDTYLKFQLKLKDKPEELIKTADEIEHSLKNFSNYHQIKEMLQLKRDNRSALNEMLPEAGIHIITMHASKGLEFDTVFLPDLSEGIIPGRRCTDQKQMEEERRLLYVAITRARDSLYLFYTNERKRKPSRFIYDLILFHHP